MKSPIQRQMELFSAALEHPAGPERDAFLAKACAGDNALLECVRTLLAGHSQAGSFLAQAAGPTGTHLLPSTEKPGDKIGRYKLLQQIGEGGCGTVYMAEQEEPVRRRVALKVIRLGMDTKSVIARFEAERQALALMDHPNIAKVFDGGATESGRPYFVMELVRGIKITEYCDQAHLSTTERLKLFIQVCQAVQHAHQKGIIHRDIKPSNILVTVNDGVAVPKVIDFGIAKATDQRLTDKTYFTEFHAFIGTPAYTSPEQAEMSSLDIDTRSDIYSLGVLLYEMLTGQTPFPAERLLQSGLDEMRRIIREEEPPRPSTRLTTLPLADASELSRKRQLKIPALANAVEGDIDWIVMKALEKDRSRRYATSLDFAADLQRHLSNEAVLARPPSLAYKFQRSVRRNKGAFAAAAAILVALLTGLGLTAWQAVRASRAEHTARAQSEQARADRDRAVLAESNATEKATQATNALLTANERMVKLNVAEGWRRVEEGDHFGALLPFAEAFALEQDKPDRAEIHQMRLASVLQRNPKLVNVWNAGTNTKHSRFSGDGERLVTYRQLERTYSATLWEAATGRPIVSHSNNAIPFQPNVIALSEDGKRFITEVHLRDSAPFDERQARGTRPGIREIQVWDTVTARPLSGVIHIDDRDLLGLHFDSHDIIHAYTRLNANGTRFLISESNRLSLWDVAKSTKLWSHSPHPHTSHWRIREAVSFSPNGRYLTFAGGILDAQSGQSITRITNIVLAEFSVDNSRLFLVEAGDGSGDRAAILDGGDLSRVVHAWREGTVPYAGRFSRDGKRLATANRDSTVRIWNTFDGSPLTSPMEHRGLVADVCFSPDGTWLATGVGKGAEETYSQVWDAATGKALTPRLPHDGQVLHVSFNHDGTQLIVEGEKGSIAIWSLLSFRAPRFTWPVPGLKERVQSTFDGVSRVQLSQDGRTLMVDEGDALVAWNLAIGRMQLPSARIHGDIRLAGSNFAIERHADNWSVVNLEDGSRVTRSTSNYFTTTNNVHAGGLSANGRWLTVHQDSGIEILVLNATNGAVAARLNRAGLSGILSNVVVRPDGKQVLAVQEGERVVCWRTATPNSPEWVSMEGLHIGGYNPSGQFLECYNLRGYPRMLETHTFREVLGEGWFDVQTSLDDTWVFGVHDRSDQWLIGCVTNGTIQSPSPTHRGWIDCGAFISDSAVLITAGMDLALRFWTVPDAERAALPITLPSQVTRILTTGDGRGFVTVHGDDTLRFWELPKTKRTVSAWLALARFFAKGRGEQESSQSAAAAEHSRAPAKFFRNEWLPLRAKHPEVFTVSADELDASHRHEAWRCESSKDWSNAVHHLTELLKTQPDSGDFLPRRAAAYVAIASDLVAAGVSRITSSNDTASPADQSRLTSAATNYLERALADYNRTLAWVDRYPAIARESRLPFVKKRREVYLNLGRKSEAEADERELKADGK